MPMCFTITIVSRHLLLILRKVIAWCNFLNQGFHFSRVSQMVSQSGASSYPRQNLPEV